MSGRYLVVKQGTAIFCLNNIHLVKVLPKTEETIPITGKWYPLRFPLQI